MSHGKRMLKAQERREQLRDAPDDAEKVPAVGASSHSTAATYLRSDRAFDADGTPNRPSRRRTSTEDDDSPHRTAVVNPASVPQLQTVEPIATSPARSARQGVGTDGYAEKPATDTSRPETAAPRKRCRSQTPPPPLRLAEGGAARQTTATAAAGFSPQCFVPPAPRTDGAVGDAARLGDSHACDTHLTSGALSTAVPIAVPVTMTGSRATPRRRTTRNYPMERVSAALSSLSPETPCDVAGEEAAPAAHRLPSLAAPRLPPLAPTLPSHSSPTHSPPSGSAATSSPIGGRIPMPSPPLRAAVSPRMEPQHLSRVNSAAASHSRGLAPGSPTCSPTAVPTAAAASATDKAEENAEVLGGGGSSGAELCSGPWVAPASSQSWALPTAAAARGGAGGGERHAAPARAFGGDEGQGGKQPGRLAATDQGQVTGQEGRVSGPSFPAVPPPYVVAPDSAEKQAVYVVGSGGGDFLAEVCTSPGSQSPPTVLANPHGGGAWPRHGTVVSPVSQSAVSATPLVSPPSQEPPADGSMRSGSRPLLLSPSPASSHGGGGGDGVTPATSLFRIGDYSGFHNRGNDCYACSVLTLLLRSTAFRAALCASPVAVAVRTLLGVKPPRITSGYLPGPPLYAPRHRGGRPHHAESPPTSSTSSEDGDSGRDRTVATETAKKQRLKDEDLVPLDAEGDPEPTAHEQLEDLVDRLWTMERVVYRVNDNLADPEEVRRSLFQRFVHRFLNKKTGENTYRRGIDLGALAQLFGGEFFTGEQEDAHEFFVSLITKLELEAERLEKDRLAAITSADPDARAGGGSSPNGGGDASGTVAGDRAENPQTPLPAPSLPPVWVNTLMQGKLLNIVRCRNAGCHHHIATEEPYVNLTVALKKSDEEESRDKAASHLPAAGEGGDAVGLQTHTSLSSVTAAVDGDAKEPPLLSQLLFRSLQYDRLDDYVCDACGSRAGQFQGACFYMEPPPMLVVQLKRFAIHAGLNASGVFEVAMTKDRSEVHVEDLLEVYSLPSCAADTPSLPYHHRASSQLGEAVLAAERCAAAAANNGGQTVSCGTSSERRSRPKSPVEEGGTPARDEGPRTPEAADTIDAIRSVYQLRGAVLHLGKQLSFGHYVCQFAVSLPQQPTTEHSAAAGEGSAERGHGRGKGSGPTLAGLRSSFPSLDEIRSALPPLPWRMADDAVVKKLNAEAVREQWKHCSRSYLLSYEKVFEERVRVPVWKVLPVMTDDGAAQTPLATPLDRGRDGDGVHGSKSSSEAEEDEDGGMTRDESYSYSW